MCVCVFTISFTLSLSLLSSFLFVLSPPSVRSSFPIYVSLSPPPCLSLLPLPPPPPSPAIPGFARLLSVYLPCKLTLDPEELCIIQCEELGCLTDWLGADWLAE